MIFFIVIPFLSLMSQAHAETNRLSLIYVAVNCVQRLDCDYFVFKRVTNWYAYRPSSFVPLIDISDELTTKGRWTKSQLSSKRPEDANNKIAKWSFELKHDDCARPNFFPEEFNKRYTKSKMMFAFMDCFLPTLVNNGNAIVCYNVGSWDISIRKCYIKLEFGLVKSTKPSLKLSRPLQEGSQIKLAGHVTKDSKCTINLANKYGDSVVRVEVEFLENQTLYFLGLPGKEERRGSDEGVQTDNLDVTIAVMEDTYELRVLGQTKLHEIHNGKFGSITKLDVLYDLPFELIQILY